MTADSELPLEIDCASVHQLLSSDCDVLLLDCREQQEHDTARIANAMLLPMSELQERVDELSPHRERRIIVHCHHGGRSLRVTQWLRQQEFPHVQSMAGGIDEWAQAIDSSVPRY